MEKRPKGFQKGHQKHGGARKGGKKSEEETIAKDFYYAYKQMGGKKALLEWGIDNKDEFFKQFKQVFGGKKQTLTDKEIRFVEDLK